MFSPLETALKGIRTVLLGNGTSKLLLILFELLIARYLGASSFGLYAIVISVTQISSSLCVLGLNYGVIQHLSIYDERREEEKKKSVIFFAAIAVAIFTGILALVLAGVSGLLAGQFFDKPDLAVPLLIAAPLMFFDAQNQLLSAVFRGMRQFRNNLMVFDLIKNVCCMLLFPLLIVAGFTVEKVLTLCLLGSFLCTCFGVMSLQRQKLWAVPSKLDLGVLKDLVSFSKLLFFWNLMQVLAVRLFILTAGVFLTAAETGALAVASRLALVFIFFQTAVGSAIQPEFARLFSRKDIQGQRELYQSVTQGLLGVVMVPAIAILVNPVFITGLFGHDYTSYGWVIWPLLCVHCVNVVTGPAGQVLIANEKQKLLMALTLFDITMQFAVVVPLMYFSGVTGAAHGEALRIFLFVILRLWFMWRVLDVHLAGRSYIPLSALSVCSIASGVALTLSGVGYFAAAGYAMAFYAAGAAWLIITDKQMQDELRLLIRF